MLRALFKGIIILTIIIFILNSIKLLYGLIPFSEFITKCLFSFILVFITFIILKKNKKI